MSGQRAFTRDMRDVTFCLDFVPWSDGGNMSGQRAFTRDMRDVTFCPYFVPYHAVPQVTLIIPLRAVGPAGLPAL
eukprot:366029-Chlamydomonas_euryale.AAC.35